MIVPAARRALFITLLIEVLWLVSATASADSAEELAPISGAGAHFSWAVMNALQRELEEATGRRIELYGRESMLGAGCNAGIKHASSHRQGHETFGLVCCPLSDAEVQEKKIKVFPLALEPIFILVNADNPVDNLTSEQVRAIFRGDISNWREVGGSDTPIVVVTRLHCKKRPGHWKTILPSAQEFRQKRLNVKSASEMVQRVSDFSGAFGHTGAAWIFDPRDRVKAISVDGYRPSAKNLSEGRYPFYRQLSAVTAEHPSQDVENLIREAQRRLVGSVTAARFELVPLGVNQQ